MERQRKTTDWLKKVLLGLLLLFCPHLLSNMSTLVISIFFILYGATLNRTMDRVIPEKYAANQWFSCLAHVGRLKRFGM